MHSMNVDEPFAKRFGDTRKVCRALQKDTAAFTIKLMERDPDTKQVTAVKFVHDSLEQHQQQFDLWRKRSLEVFVMVGITDGGGMAARNVTGTSAVAVDFDEGFDPAVWQDSHYAPTLLVQTSKQRFHAIWLLREELDGAQFDELASALAWRLGGDPCFAQIAQAIRLPGFINRKHGTQVSLEDVLVEEGHYKRYGFKELSDAFDARLVTAHLNRTVLPSRWSRENGDEDAENENMEDIAEALKHVHADDYDVWVRVGMALRSLKEPGFEAWNSWSAQSKKYEVGIMRKKWESFGADGELSPKTIFYLAAKSGWKNSGYQKTGFSTNLDIPSERELGRMIAHKMAEDYAVVPHTSGSRAKLSYQFLKWDGAKNRPLTDHERREALDKEWRALFTGPSRYDVLRGLKQKMGTNAGLDSLGEHVGDFLQPSCAAREATAYPYLSLGNGVINLLTGELVPPRLRPFAKYHSPVIFDPTVKAPRFKQFVKEIFEDDREMCKYIMRLFGHIMLGNPVEHVMVVFYGKGGNGKSKLVNVLRYVLGDYARSLPPMAVMAKSHASDSATPALAKLPGMRLAVISEPSGKHKLDAGMIKNLTGGEHVSARALFGDTQDFLPECVPLMVTNEMPNVRDDDEGLWRRLHVVEFNRKFEGSEKDRYLEEKLRQEVSGILNLLLKGVQDYLCNGLNPPKKVQSSTGKIRSEMDPFEQFFNECLVVDESKDTEFKAIHAAYKVWQRENHAFRPLSGIMLGRKLEQRFSKYAKRNSPWYRGIRLVVPALV